MVLEDNSYKLCVRIKFDFAYHQSRSKQTNLLEWMFSFGDAFHFDEEWWFNEEDVIKYGIHLVSNSSPQKVEP